MSTNRLATIATVFLSGSVAAAIALSSPASARGGRHHGECGEHRSSHECGYPEYEAHHHGGHHGRHFEDHHGYDRGVGSPRSYPSGTDDRDRPRSGGGAGTGES